MKLQGIISSVFYRYHYILKKTTCNYKINKEADITMEESTDISIKQATQELLHTAIFQNISKRTNEMFAQKLAFWLVRYILLISSMNESLNINLEQILANLHGERLKKIVSITNNSVNSTNKESNNSDYYIW